MSALRHLLAPVCALAALGLSAPAFAAEPPAADADVEADASLDTSTADTSTDAPATTDGEASGSLDTSAPVATSEPEPTQVTTIEHEIGGDEDAVAGAPAGVSHGGRLGIGAVRTGAGLNGINIRYFINDNIHIGVNLGVATFSYRYPDPADGVDCAMDVLSDTCTKKVRTIAYIGSSLEFVYWIQGKPSTALPFQADFGVGGRLGFQHLVNSTDIPDNLDDALQLTAEIPLAISLNFGQNFSIIPEFGAAFRWNPGTRLGNMTDPADSNPGFGDPNGRLPPGEVAGPGFGFEINDHVGLFGGASLLYTF